MSKQVIVIRTKYPDGNGAFRKLRIGKYIAQACHASTAILCDIINSGRKLTSEEQSWIAGSFTKICLYVETEEELLALYKATKAAGLTSNLIQDAGCTEFHGVPTYTALGIGPHKEELIDPFTKDLKLL